MAVRIGAATVGWVPDRIANSQMTIFGGWLRNFGIT